MVFALPKHNQMPQSIPDAPPQLLVSVRNATEAQAALAGGCDIIDVKEPSRGSLGMADPPDINAIITFARSTTPTIPVSVALGEALDWNDSRTLPHLRTSPDYVKLGTAGLARSNNRPDLWTRAAERWKRAGRLSSAWIVVAYADHQNADAPAPETIIQSAAELGVVGVLIDTWDKQTSGLRSWLTDLEISRLRDRALAHELFFALAGKLRTTDLPAIADLSPNIVGIRGAACRGHDRESQLDPHAIAEFKRQLRISCCRQATS